MNLEDVLKGKTLEERIYRHRCVERSSMVIPWIGFPLTILVAGLYDEALPNQDGAPLRLAVPWNPGFSSTVQNGGTARGLTNPTPGSSVLLCGQ